MLKQRIITALVLVVITVWALFYASDMGWKITLLALAMVAAWEWTGFSRLYIKVLKVLYVLAVVIVANFMMIYAAVEHFVVLTIIEAILLMMVVHRYQFSESQRGLASATAIGLIGLLAIALFVSALYQFRAEMGPTILLLSMALVWAIDTGAYFSGRRFGKRKLAQFVSPGKTWEGVAGGGLFTFVFALVVLFVIDINLSLPKVMVALILTLIALFSIYGDLFESVLKRQVSLKDSGQILPGHGGVLDRVDSLIIAMPMLYIVWHYLQA